MHLKSLTLRGFKSFASATTLRFEPGITCVVGPNGSGKSNVVDALTWVMGEQGAKALRGGKMEDVIFAGTAGRPPLGRAEVSLTIDNSDGALPIDYAEVSITRRMFRDGASEYEINGSACRLLDVQELLSDSGIGREMHVVVGQGQLEQVLSARPEDRRAFVEEAAGVLKHRKRKEKALRKLDATAANLTRLTDLTGELRRQLKPLGRQADVARRAQAVQAELRDARLRLAADDLVGLRAALARDEAGEQAVRDRRDRLDGALGAARAELAAAEELLAGSAPRLAAAQDAWYRLSGLGERLRGTVGLATERARHLSAAPVAAPGRDPDELEREADAAAVAETGRAAEVDRLRAALTDEQERRAELEAAVAAAERAVSAAARAVADRREGLARLGGQVDAARSTAAAAGEEAERLAAAAEDAERRAEAARAEADGLERRIGVLDAEEVTLDGRHEAALAAHEAASGRVAGLAAALREAEQHRASEAARVEALSAALAPRDGTAALLGADRPDGVLGAVSALVTVEPGAETAVAAALGDAADAVAVDGVDAAVAALELLRGSGAGRAGLVVTGTVTGAVEPGRPRRALPDGARWAADLVSASGPLRAALHRLLDHTAVVADLAAARRLVAAHPDVRAVTADGDVLGAQEARGGSGRGRSALEVQAAVDGAAARGAEAGRRVEQLGAKLAAARADEAERREHAENTLAALHESDAELSAVAEQLGRAGQAARSAAAEAQRLRRQRETVAERRDSALARLDELAERLRLARDEPVDDAPDTAARDEAAAALTGARAVEVEARLALRTAEERARAGAGRADGLRRAARTERAARARAAELAAARERGAAVAAAVAAAGREGLAHLERSLARAGEERDAARRGLEEHERAAAALRPRVRELTDELARLTDSAHREDVARTERRLRLEQLEARTTAELGVAPADLVAEYGPDVPVPPPAAEVAEAEAARARGDAVAAPQPVPYDRAGQERRAARAERDLALLGRVNPLALEEFAALEERYRFLSTQLEDLKATRRDLLTVVSEVDARILQLFAAAYEDVAREFEGVFRTLFPGGEGRLVLTEPGDLLTTGIEVEARPPGKKVKRLSLLSGGEKSLTAVALLVAIFRARPSPFYVLDEVEAALDETNLRRLIALLELLRDRSQLIVITHQKQTMEVADALYGVSMRGDGITTVISQRLRGDGAGRGAAVAAG